MRDAGYCVVTLPMETFEIHLRRRRRCDRHNSRLPTHTPNGPQQHKPSHQPWSVSHSAHVSTPTRSASSHAHITQIDHSSAGQTRTDPRQLDKLDTS